MSHMAQHARVRAQYTHRQISGKTTSVCRIPHSSRGAAPLATTYAAHDTTGLHRSHPDTMRAYAQHCQSPIELL